MTPGEIGAMLTNLNNIQLKLEAASGAAVAVEMRMRLIGQLCEQVRDKLKELVNTYKASNKPKQPPSNKYWDCELSFLDQAIDEIFHDKLEPNERQKIEDFRPLRNKLLHADFVTLMKRMGIDPTGRQILSTDGKRNILDSADIKEAVLSIDRNQGFEKFQVRAKEVRSILDRLSLALPTYKLIVL